MTDDGVWILLFRVKVARSWPVFGLAGTLPGLVGGGWRGWGVGGGCGGGACSSTALHGAAVLCGLPSHCPVRSALITRTSC